VLGARISLRLNLISISVLFEAGIFGKRHVRPAFRNAEEFAAVAPQKKDWEQAENAPIVDSERKLPLILNVYVYFNDLPVRDT
jgi:hypothetical protein